MELTSIIQLVSGLATLYAQEAPLLAKAASAIQSGDQGQLDALLVQIQAENDKLGMG